MLRFDPHDQLPYVVVPGKLNKPLVEAVCSILNVPVHPVTYCRFSNDDIDVEIGRPIRGRTVFLLTHAYPDLPSSSMETLLVIDAVKRAAAKRIIVIVPLLPYSVNTDSDDREGKHTDSVLSRTDPERKQRIQLARMHAKLLETAGCNEVVAVELNMPQWEGLFGIPFSNLSVTELIADIVCKETSLNRNGSFVLVPLELSGGKRVDRILDAILERGTGVHIEIANIYRRPNGQVLFTKGFDFGGKRVLLVDDFIRTGRRLEATCNWLQSMGVASCTGIVIHAFVTSGAVRRISDLTALNRLYVSDSVSSGHTFPEKMKIYSVAQVLAEAIEHINDNTDLCDLLVND